MTDARWIIYLVTGPNGKRYVGLTKRPLIQRWKQHVSDAMKGSKYALHSAIRKHGASKFFVCVLTTCVDQLEAIACEKGLIAQYGTYAHGANGYNLTSGGDGAYNRKVSEAERQAISRRFKGRRHTEETKAKLSAAHTGKHHEPISETHKERLREFATGRTKSAATRAKISAWRKGRKRSPESIAKQAATMRANKAHLRLEAGLTPEQVHEKKMRNLPQYWEPTMGRVFYRVWRHKGAAQLPLL